MAILTMGGSLTDDVEAALNLTTPVDPSTQEGSMITTIVRAAEAFVKGATGRVFEQKVIVDEAYDVALGMRELWLSDRPIVSIESIGEVYSRNLDGTPVVTPIPASEYVFDKSAGLVSRLGGSRFYPGTQTVVVSWTAGYTPAEIAAASTDELRVLKHLCLSLVQSWYKKRKDTSGHTISMSFGGESVSPHFGLTEDEKLLLDQLRLW